MTEHGEQAAYVEWAGMNQGRYWQLELLHSVPNGAALARTKRADGSWSRGSKQAAKLLREGMKKGILDMNLPVLGILGIGLWIEFKFGTNTLTEDQERIAALLRKAGHWVEVCYTAEAAIDITETHLGVPPGQRTQHFR